jgi:phospholipid/cholesterol/gamma-HCH transport system substrate-binding protein
MTSPTNHFKLGLFVIFVIGIIVTSAGVLGARTAKKETILYHTYFNESVQGLDVGAPVKFRGVDIGVVSAIEIGPDHRHVDVVMELDDIERMGLTEKHEHAVLERKPTRFYVPSDLRAQLASQGITGVKFLLIDYFNEVQNPVPALPFAANENYIPAAVSLFKNLEDSMVQALDELPKVMEKLTSIMGNIDGAIAELRAKQLPDKIVKVVENADKALGDLRFFMKDMNQAQIPAKVSKALVNADEAVTKMNSVLKRVDGDKGLVASAHRATDSFGDVGKSANGSIKTLDDTLRDLSEAAQAMRDLAEALEKDPDMLLKGRSPKKEIGK